MFYVMVVGIWLFIELFVRKLLSFNIIGNLLLLFFYYWYSSGIGFLNGFSELDLKDLIKLIVDLDRDILVSLEMDDELINCIKYFLLFFLPTTFKGLYSFSKSKKRIWWCGIKITHEVIEVFEEITIFFCIICTNKC